jgi:hypothetical protein
MKGTTLLRSLTRSLLRGLAVLACLAAGQAAFALEFGLDAATGNLQIPWTRLTPITADPYPTGYYYLGGDAWLNAPLGDDASVRFAYDRDPVLRNMMLAAVQFDRGIARISVGPLFGFLNSDSSLFSAGMTASVRLQWPGVAYVALRSDGGTAISIFQANADPQAQTELSAGFYVPHAIVSGLVSAKRFNELDAGGKLVTDTLTRYAMTVDVFKKNVPYNALLSIGYELRSKHYEAADETDSLGAIVLGIDAAAQVARGYTLKGGISTGAYVFGLDALRGRGPGNSAFMFSANVGMAVDTAQIKLPPKRAAAQEEAAPGASAPEAAPGAEAAPETAAPEAGAAAPAPEGAPPAETEAAPQKEKPKYSRLALDAGAGLFYNDRLSLAGSLGIVAKIFNSRAGVWGGVGYRITPLLSIGAEVGFDYLTLSSGGTKLSLWDLPVNASFRYSLGKAELEAFTGPFFNGVSADATGFASYMDYDFGIRARLGGFYAEASYVLGIQSTGISVSGVGSVADNYLRFGLGYAIKFM